MEVCYWALLFMPLVILHHLLNVFVQLANKRGFTKKKNNNNNYTDIKLHNPQSTQNTLPTNQDIVNHLNLIR
jgi:hypothetical protein